VPAANANPNPTIKPHDDVLDVIIIGTGFSGIAMAHYLQKAGIESFVMLEKATEVGGTWRDNTYPGCACDVQSHLYSLSFQGNPEWSATYAGHAEIQRYILDCVQRMDLRPRIEFDCTVVSATFDESDGCWTLLSKDGRSFRARTFIMGTGPLHVPSYPNIPGLDTFEGKVMHSARWDHDHDLTGKRVASIGTGGSAIQYVPTIAEQVGELHVYQRTPPWVIRRHERDYSQFERRMFRSVPATRKAHRAWLYTRNEIRVLPIFFPSIANAFTAMLRSHLQRQLDDPDLAAKMTPDYAIGCKRVLISNTWYPTFRRDNVELVSDGIREITKTGVVTNSGTHREVDTIILGTGFIADPRVFMKKLPVTGLGGRTLMEAWKDSPDAYLGMSVDGFPNLHFMVGPNTGLGHNSMIFMIEAQAHHIAQSVQLMKRTDTSYMHVKPPVLRSFNEQIRKKLQGTAWTAGCTSWYSGKDGKNIAIWPGFTFSYWLRTRRVKRERYDWVTGPSQTASAPTD
jgi:cation diffusion facilitator CzcD-associated flavoprotein CzcO